VAKIDLETEAVLRKILYAAIKEDSASFENQMESFPSGDSLIAACARASEVAALIIAEQYKGRPTPEMITRLADFSAQANEEWSGITSSDFAAFIHAILEDTPLENVLPVGVAIRVPFVLAAQLMVQFKKPGTTGFDYLDHLWEVLETRQD
jgi:hypothetical protein